MPVDKHSLSRRSLFKAASIALAAGTVGASAITNAPKAAAYPAGVLGTIIDFAAGVPTAASVKAAGHMGAIRYVSARRPGAEWMLGKPVSLKETQDYAAHGLFTASIYQFGREATADWKAGAAGAATHAPQAIAYHKAAGGPTGVPIYVAIDDNPTWAQYTGQIRPYLQAFQVALRAAGYSMGVYGNYSTIDWAIADKLGQFYWQHNWGSNGRIHPAIHLHQAKNSYGEVGGVVADLNHVYKTNWGQWQPGKATAPVPPAPPAAPTQPTQPASPGSRLPDINLGGSSISGDQLEQGLKLAQQIAQAAR